MSCYAGRSDSLRRASARDLRSRDSAVAACITKRDQLICIDLKEHRVLTSEQLFSQTRVLSEHDLGFLVSTPWGIVGGTGPRSAGSLPWHNALDGIGA
jgi:hypothetical protein